MLPAELPLTAASRAAPPPAAEGPLTRTLPPCSYNSIMKVTFIATAVSIIRYMRFDKVVKQTYDKEQVRAGSGSQPVRRLPLRRAAMCIWQLPCERAVVLSIGRALVTTRLPPLPAWASCCHLMSHGRHR